MAISKKDFACPNCGYSEHISGAHFCQNCGIELLNFCTNPNCETNELPSEEYQAIPHDAKYCPYCGEKSTYYDYLTALEEK